MLTRKEFWQKARRLALTKGAVVTVAAGSVLSILLPFASLLDPHRDEHARFWATFDKYGFAYFSILIFCLFVIRHFLRAAYFVYEEEQTNGSDRLQKLERELDEVKSKRPDFSIVVERSPVGTWIGWHGPLKMHIARVYGRMAFQNIGDGIAFNTAVSFYFCWLANPATNSTYN